MTRGARRPQADLEIVARGADEAVVFKPAGLSSERAQASVGDGSDAGSDTASDSLLSRAQAALGWSEARLPHRLDRPTRGLVVISRDGAAAARHAEEIRAHAWTKWYFARLPSRTKAGAAQALVGPHKAYLKRIGKRAEVVRAGGDPSRLAVVAVAPATDRAGESHALILLETGRYHQIRAMLAHLGFPLVGDAMYGGAARDAGLDLEAVALRIDRADGARVHRLAQHADRRGVAPELERALDDAISGAPRA